ncbi:MAG: M23 family metallopeptidase [Firmicutes bacterium]|nr:M23 family metallopeptidase [Bacillota bacterium]
MTVNVTDAISTEQYLASRDGVNLVKAVHIKLYKEKNEGREGDPNPQDVPYFNFGIDKNFVKFGITDEDIVVDDGGQVKLKGGGVIALCGFRYGGEYNMGQDIASIERFNGLALPANLKYSWKITKANEFKDFSLTKIRNNYQEENCVIYDGFKIPISTPIHEDKLSVPGKYLLEITLTTCEWQKMNVPGEKAWMVVENLLGNSVAKYTDTIVIKRTIFVAKIVEGKEKDKYKRTERIIDFNEKKRGNSEQDSKNKITNNRVYQDDLELVKPDFKNSLSLTAIDMEMIYAKHILHNTLNEGEYCMPFASGDNRKITQGFWGTTSHRGSSKDTTTSGIDIQSGGDSNVVLFSMLEGQVVSINGTALNDGDNIPTIVEFDIYTENIGNGIYRAEVLGIPDRIAVLVNPDNLEITDNKGKIRLQATAGDGLTKRGRYNNLILRIINQNNEAEIVTSERFSLTAGYSPNNQPRVVVKNSNELLASKVDKDTDQNRALFSVTTNRIYDGDYDFDVLNLPPDILVYGKDEKNNDYIKKIRINNNTGSLMFIGSENTKAGDLSNLRLIIKNTIPENASSSTVFNLKIINPLPEKPLSTEIKVGTQCGTLISGNQGTIEFPISTNNIPGNTYSVSVDNIPEGLSVDNNGNVIINKDGTGKVIIKGSSTVVGKHSLILTINNIKSNKFILEIVPLIRKISIGKQNIQLRAKNYNETVIKTNDGYFLAYLHIKENSSNHLNVNSTVKAGTPIGIVGNSYNFNNQNGNPAIHLHFQISDRPPGDRPQDSDDDKNWFKKFREYRIDPLRFFDLDEVNDGKFELLWYN